MPERRGTAGNPPLLIRVFERFEFKYWVTDAVAHEVADFIRPYLVPDVYAGRVVQRNTSLYLDNDALDFWHCHVDDAPDRFKLRVRMYGDPPEGPAFFEVKRKIKNVIVKRRVRVAHDDVKPLLDGTWTKLPSLRADDLRTLESFLYLMAVHRASPKVAVACEREAYRAANAEEDTRLTIDRDIVYQPYGLADFDSVSKKEGLAIDTEREHTYAGHRVMLELKFRNAAPEWMRDLSSRLSLWRAGYSKYVSAVRHEHFERYRTLDHSQVPTRFTFDEGEAAAVRWRPALAP